MAVVKRFSIEDQNSRIGHTECAGVIRKIEVDGQKFIQIDTYGSVNREIPDKLSQSLRLTEEAFQQLMKLGADHF